MKMPRFKLCFVVALISFCIAPYLSNLLPGGGEEAQRWLDREIAHIERCIETCEDDYVRSAMEYTVKHYRRVGPFGVRVMQLPDGTHGYNMPTCPGITIDEEVQHMGLEYGAFVLVHEAMHNWSFPPSFFHYHIDNDAILEAL
jgi:hypothetical protein